MDIETPPPYDVESLPSYTIVSGLPSYQDAIEQLKQKQLKYYEPVRVHRPSVMKLFESQDLLAHANGSQNNPQKLEEIRYNFVRPQLSVNELATVVDGTMLEAGNDTATPPTPPTTSVVSTALPVMPATPPPPPYKSQISTISTTSSSTVSGVVPVPVNPCGATNPSAELAAVAIRVPQKKIGVCHYTVENERTAGRS